MTAGKLGVSPPAGIPATAGTTPTTPSQTMPDTDDDYLGYAFPQDLLKDMDDAAA